DPSREFTTILDAMDPRNVWTGEVLRYSEHPISRRAHGGFAANCNVSASLVDPAISLPSFPKSIVYSWAPLTTWRQLAAQRHGAQLIRAKRGRITLQDLEEMSGDERDPRWEYLVETLRQSFTFHLASGFNPLASLSEQDRGAVLTTFSWLWKEYEARGLYANESSEHATFLQHFSSLCSRPNLNSSREDVCKIVNGGRPNAGFVLTAREQYRELIMLFADAVRSYLPENGRFKPYRESRMLVYYKRGEPTVTSLGGSDSSLRTNGGTLVETPWSNVTAVHAGQAMPTAIELTRPGPGRQPRVRYLTPTGQWELQDLVFNYVLPERFARHHYTDLTR
ncbi:MAG: penicillin acylase family protein, partial [Bdellovibrionales bacterium]|nr:penicillin acylase family protein [Bdellovibrionales bacterium]